MKADSNSNPSVGPPLFFEAPLAWLALFGPGAIIASLTIGTGELIFSTRGGALFGYRVLFLFVLISVLKWGMVVAMARHMVLTGVHPYQRFLELPGPRGWFLTLILLVLAICMPVWVSFHSAVIGNLSSWVTGTSDVSGIDFVWGGSILVGLLLLSAFGGYSLLERVQLFIVCALVLSAMVTLIIYQPDWLAIVRGAVLPSHLAYPDWINKDSYPNIANQPVWVETTRYVGVIGGAAFDYLAYTSWIRDKQWGWAGKKPATSVELAEMAANPQHPIRLWIKAPVVDCTICFLLVVLFCAVFVAAGTLFLGPNHKVPDEANLLNLQAQFVTVLHPWLLPLYVSGAFLTMLGTLYGVIEVANAALRELAYTANRFFAETYEVRLRRFSTVWCAVGALGVLSWMCIHQLQGGVEKPRILLDVMTPANLFTGVFSCGYICWLLVWMDRKFLPPALRMPTWLWLLNLVSGLLFLVLGMRGFWEDKTRWFSIGLVGAMLFMSLIICWMFDPWKRFAVGDQTSWRA